MNEYLVILSKANNLLISVIKSNSKRNAVLNILSETSFYSEISSISDYDDLILHLQTVIGAFVICSQCTNNIVLDNNTISVTLTK